MRLGRAVRGHLFEYGRGFGSKRGRNYALDHCAKPFFIGMHPGRQPQRRSGIEVGTKALPLEKALLPNARTIRGLAARYWCARGQVHRAMGSAANASAIVPTAGSSSAAAIILTVGDFTLPS